ncbi:energy-coupling factor ABC transporter substrate-binding protein [Haloarculaceae archaeon H-GB2-1]|nr:energy-coupling factor ABC transporter substrate-binding protein [Haloarculaceae archaeon H-GB1-1]MEA5388839.1 energy-coupling factor ABC transporter substrate-binding protein [Haloarculaceae archaeon H-GB11]MEA5406897.1 energy-coupling factor ABC transporter substrate-binding protein [Haloarculaceae archaeon H-GB2-1]
MTRGRLVVAAAALAVVVVVVGPFVYPSGFGGADVAAREQTESIAPGYEPWMASLWAPSTVLGETLLFGLQAAVGAGLVWYAVRRFDSSNDAATDRSE